MGHVHEPPVSLQSTSNHSFTNLRAITMKRCWSGISYVDDDDDELILGHPSELGFPSFGFKIFQVPKGIRANCQSEQKCRCLIFVKHLDGNTPSSYE